MHIIRGQALPLSHLIGWGGSCMDRMWPSWVMWENDKNCHIFNAWGWPLYLSVICLRKDNNYISVYTHWLGFIQTTRNRVFSVVVLWLWLLLNCAYACKQMTCAWPLYAKVDTCACLTKCNWMKPIVSSSACYLVYSEACTARFLL